MDDFVRTTLQGKRADAAHLPRHGVPLSFLPHIPHKLSARDVPTSMAAMVAVWDDRKEQKQVGQLKHGNGECNRRRRHPQQPPRRSGIPRCNLRQQLQPDPHIRQQQRTCRAQGGTLHASGRDPGGAGHRPAVRPVQRTVQLQLVHDQRKQFHHHQVWVLVIRQIHYYFWSERCVCMVSS